MPKIDILDANEKMNEQSSSSPLSSFYLPSERSINTSHLYEAQGWKVQTEVKKSNIPGAGFGRFAKVDIPKGTRIFAKPIVSMSSITSVISVPHDKCIMFDNAEDIQNIVELYKKEAGRNHEEVIDFLSHFVGTLSSFPGCAVFTSSVMTNHGDPGQDENYAIKQDGDLVVGEAVQFIKKGEEILNDYRNFDHFPNFWRDFCEVANILDVVTNLKEVLDVSAPLK